MFTSSTNIEYLLNILLKALGERSLTRGIGLGAEFSWSFAQ